MNPDIQLFERCLQQRRFNQALTYINQHSENHDKNDIAIQTLWLKYYKARGYHLEAAKAAQAIYAVKPDSAFYQNEYAVTLRLAGQAAQAIPLLERLAQQKQHFAVFHNLANCYSDLGEYPPAIAHYKKAIHYNPLYADSHINLNKLLWEAGNQDEYLRSFEQAIARHPTAHHLVFSFVHFLLDAKRYQQALKLLDSHRFPAESIHTVHFLKAQALRYTGDYKAAISLYESLLQAPSPGNAASVLVEMGIALLLDKQFHRASEVLQQALVAAPENQLAKAYLYAVDRHSGRNPQSIASLIECEDLKDEFTATFWEDLKQELLHMHKAIQQPIGQTLENGSQTRGHLFSLPSPIIQQLKNKLSGRLLDYATRQKIPVATITDTQGEPYYSGSWSVRLKRAGYHHDHIHSQGVLSAVVYIDLPKQLADSKEQRGWLKLGSPQLTEELQLPPEVTIQPKVGRCVIFPSYLWHGTLPFDETAERLTIAFDIGRYGLTSTD